MPESKLHINYLELKVLFLALKEFQDFCSDKIVLVATDNTTVGSYINKEGGMRSGSLCALLWRILTWCTRKQVTLKVGHIPGRLNVVADKLSRLGKTIETEWSLFPEVFQSICSRWHQPQVDLFATRFNKLPLCHQYQIPWHGQWTHSVCHGMIWMHMPSHQPPSGQSGGEVAGPPMQKDHSDCSRVAQHALVLGSSGHFQPDPAKSAQSSQPANTALQPDPSQNSDQTKSPCMAPRASSIKEQGFSEAVAARIEASQRGSTRSVYEAKWTIFTK